VDNDIDPDEIDGRIYEIRIQSGRPLNLVKNPSMEARGETGETGVPGWDPHPDVERSRDFARTGGHSLRLQGTDQSGVDISRTVRGMEPGRSYTFGAWVNVPPPAQRFAFKIRIRWRDAAGATISTSTAAEFRASTAGWDKVVVSVTAPPGAASMRIVLTLDGPAAVYLDDLLFQPVGP
jgi:hypothetical protein